jgi:ABC-2 type transport system permease protein
MNDAVERWAENAEFSAATRLLLRAEWRRFVGHRLNLWTTSVLVLVLSACAVWSGNDARAVRQRLVHEQAVASQAGQEARDLVSQREASGTSDGKKAAGDTFQFASRQSPPAVLEPLGGLVLSARSFGRLDTTQHVTLESRRTDARRSEPIINPLLEQFGLPDFSMVVALLLPLAVIGLCFGLVQEERERGTWRLILAQAVRPGHLLAIALLLRWAVIVAVGAVASLLAFAIDPGATWSAYSWWMLLVALYASAWIGLCGWISGSRLTSTAAALAAIGIWLATMFVVPALVSWHLDRQQPMPSRLQEIVHVREAQQDAEVRMEALLAAWYLAHPGDSPEGINKHDWPVSFLPRYLEQEALIRRRIATLNTVRADRFTTFERRALLSPAMALITAADRLAGSDMPRYAEYATAVDRFEDVWRGFFVPKIMSYQGLSSSDFARIPRFKAELRSDAPISALCSLLGFSALMLLGAVLMRKGLAETEQHG